MKQYANPVLKPRKSCLCNITETRLKHKPNRTCLRQKHKHYPQKLTKSLNAGIVAKSRYEKIASPSTHANEQLPLAKDVETTERVGSMDMWRGRTATIIYFFDLLPSIVSSLKKKNKNKIRVRRSRRTVLKQDNIAFFWEAVFL